MIGTGAGQVHATRESWPRIRISIARTPESKAFELFECRNLREDGRDSVQLRFDAVELDCQGGENGFREEFDDGEGE